MSETDINLLSTDSGSHPTDSESHPTDSGSHPPDSEQSKKRKWCALPEGAFCRILFKALCMIAISKPSVEHWEELSRMHEINSSPTPTEEKEKKEKEEQWEKHKKLVINRFENMNVTAGLVLTSSAVFISTNPPMQSLIPYANYASYSLEVISFVTALISLMTGTSVLIIYDTCYAHKDLLESFKDSRSRLVLCLLLMAFPSLALVVSTSALMLAMLIAGVTSDKLLVKILTGATCAISIVIAIAAIYVFNTPLQKAFHGDNNATTDGRSGSRSATPTWIRRLVYPNLCSSCQRKQPV